MGERFCVRYTVAGKFSRQAFDRLSDDYGIDEVDVEFVGGSAVPSYFVATDYEANYANNEGFENLIGIDTFCVKRIEAKYEYGAALLYTLPGSADWIEIQCDHDHHPSVNLSRLSGMLEGDAEAVVENLQAYIAKEQLPDIPELELV